MTTTQEYAKGGIVSGVVFLESDTGVELVGKLEKVNRGNCGELLHGIRAAFAPAPDSGKELVNQFTNDVMRYFPEWNDKEIAEKKLDLYFACVSGKIEDIQRLEAEIETLQQQLHKKESRKSWQDEDTFKEMMLAITQGVPVRTDKP